MNARSRLSAAVIGAIAVFAVSGCTDAKDMQIQALQEELENCKKDKADLEARLASCMSDAENARRRALQLQDMLDEARRQLAERPAQPSGPVMPEGWQGNQNIAWTDIQAEILFDSGKADLKGSGRSALDRVMSDIRSNFANREIWIIGHTDTDPIKFSKWKDNLELSLARGAVVARELTKQGLDPARVVAAGQGEHNPVAPNDTKANKARNRRVQIVAVVRPAAALMSGESAGM